MSRLTRKTAVWILAITGFFFVTSIYPLMCCNPFWLVWHSQGMAAAKKNGQVEIQPAREFVELYPNAQHSISYYTGVVSDPVWNSEVGLHGRYILTMHVEINFDWSRRHVVSHGEPEYILVEVQEVTDVTGSYSCRGSSQRNFGSNEWNAIYRAKGDLGILGIQVGGGEPVANFDRAWKH